MDSFQERKHKNFQVVSVETEKNERPKVLVLYIDVVVKKKARLRLNSFECFLSVVLMVLC